MSGALKKVSATGVTPIAPATDSAAIFAMIERLAVDPTVSVERIEHLFNLYQRVEADKARKEWAAAFVEVSAAVTSIIKDANNKQTSSKYASFAALDDALRPHYSKGGFAPTYSTEASDKPDHIKIVMCLVHRSGHERRYEIDMPADGKGAKGGDVMTKTHAVGSAFSYGKRYLLGAAFGAASKDDDANAASGKEPLALISEAQIAEIQTLIAETGTRLEQYLTMGKISDLSEITVANFAMAKKVLTDKRDAQIARNSAHAG
jgi:ERF superfamily